MDDGVEHQRVAADGFAAPHRVAGEQQHVALAVARIDHGGALGHLAAVVEQAGDQQLVRRGEAQDHLGPLVRRDHPGIVARLFGVERRGLPWLDVGQRLGFDGGASLGRVGVVRATAAGGALEILGRRQAVVAGEEVGDLERLPFGAVDRQIVAPIAGRDRVLAVDELRLQHAADHLQLVGRRDRDARRQAHVDREARGVLGGDQQAAFMHEALEVGHAGFAQAGPDVVGAVDAADVGGQRGGLPRHRLAPHRQAIDDPAARRVADRAEQDHVVLRAQVGQFRHVLGADVVVLHLQLVQRHAPPALGLRAEPGVHHRDARESRVRQVDRGQPRGHVHRGIQLAHRRLQDGVVGDAHHLHVEQVAHRPGGVVVRVLLRILRRPVLAIEQGVGDARVGLVHAHHDAAGGEAARGGLVFLAVVALRLRHADLDRRGAAAQFHMLALQDAQQLRARAGARVVGGEDVGGRAGVLRLLDRALALQVVVLQEQLAVVGKVLQRGEQAGLLVVVVVALRPGHHRQRRVRLVPGALVFLRLENALDGVGAVVAEGFVEPTDAVVHGGDEHQIARAPGVEAAVGEHAGHAELGHLLHVVPAQLLPFAGEDGVDPGVVGAVADGVVVQKRHRLVQVVQHLGVPADEGVGDVAGEVQRHRHRVAVVVVRHVMAPVQQARIVPAGMGAVPVVAVHLAVAAVHLDDRRDQGDHVRADVLDVGRVVHRQPVGQFHQRGGRAGFGGVDGAGDVVDRGGLGDQRVGGSIVHADRARVGQLGQACVVGIQAGQQIFIGHGDRDHRAALLALADGEHLHPRAGRRQRPEVAVDVGGVGQVIRRAGDVAEHLQRRRHGSRGGQVVGQRRVERGIGGVLQDLRRVRLVDRLRRVTRVGDRAVRLGGGGGCTTGQRQQGKQRDSTTSGHGHGSPSQRGNRSSHCARTRTCLPGPRRGWFSVGRAGRSRPPPMTADDRTGPGHLVDAATAVVAPGPMLEPTNCTICWYSSARFFSS